MDTILNFFTSLSTAELVMCLAFLVLILIVLLIISPSKDSDKSQQVDSTPAPSFKKKKSFERKEPGWDGTANTSTQNNFEQPKKKGFFARLFGGGNKTNQANDSEVLAAQNAKRSGFNHPNVTDHFSELVKPGPVSDLKAPDTDELDQIFTAMLKSGAVSGKPHLVTNYEHQYLEKLRIWFSYRCYIYCQVSVGSVVSINAEVSNLSLPQRLKFAQKCQNMSFDFLLVEKSTERIVCAIELDDPTHLRPDRMSRDRRLDKVCAAANIPIFHITNIYHKPDLRRMLKGTN